MAYSQILAQVKQTQRPLSLVFDRLVAERQLDQLPTAEPTHATKQSNLPDGGIVERVVLAPSRASVADQCTEVALIAKSAVSEALDEFSCHEAATLIQSVFRGFSRRKQYRLAGFMNPHEAATCIQMMWRGFSVRRPVLRLDTLRVTDTEEELRLAEAEVEAARLAVQKQRLELEAKVAAARLEACRRRDKAASAAGQGAADVPAREAGNCEVEETQEGTVARNVIVGEADLSPKSPLSSFARLEKVDSSSSDPEDNEIVALAELEWSARPTAGCWRTSQGYERVSRPIRQHKHTDRGGRSRSFGCVESIYLACCCFRGPDVGCAPGWSSNRVGQSFCAGGL
jgi:hypothetical protein